MERNFALGIRIATGAYALLCLSPFSFAQSTEAKAKVDGTFAHQKADAPGTVVVVVQGESIVYSSAKGIADMEHRVPLTLDTVFNVASVSKIVTAMSVMLLVQDGKLSLDDDIHKYIAGLPDYGHKITLSDLLHHESGLRDYIALLVTAGWSLEDPMSVRQIDSIIRRQQGLNFQPREKTGYSNTDYQLLAEIVEKVAGRPFAEFAQTRIFGPCRMSNTQYVSDHNAVIKDRAGSYYPAGPNNFGYIPCNEEGLDLMYSSAADLAKLLIALNRKEIGGPDMLPRLCEKGVLASGETTDYGAGLLMGELGGHQEVGHNGGSAGFRCDVKLFPKDKLGVIVLSNLVTTSALGINQMVAEAFLGLKSEKVELPETKTPSSIKLTEADALSYVGRYRMPDGTIYEVTKTQEGLMCDRTDKNAELLVALPGGDFSAFEEKIAFKKDGGVVSQLIRTSNGQTQIGQKLPVLNDQQLAWFTGDYYSAELDTIYHVIVRDGVLVATNLRVGDLPLSYCGERSFDGKQWFFGDMKFNGDSNERADGFVLDSFRCKGVLFKRAAKM